MNEPWLKALYPLPGQIRVYFDERMSPGKWHPSQRGSEIYMHCSDCLDAMVAEANRRFATIRTEPPCLLDKDTGELIDLESEPEPEPRWKSP